MSKQIKIIENKIKSFIHNSLFVIHDRSGQSLIEVLIALAIGAILIGTASIAMVVVLNSSTVNQNQQNASALAREMLEKVNALTSADWHNLSDLSHGSSTVYYITASSSELAIIAGKEGMTENDIYQGLIGYWKFDEASGSVTYDHSGNNYDGTLYNSPTRESSGNCVVGKCLNLDPLQTQYVGLPSISISNDITVAAWVYSVNNNQTGFVIAKNPIDTQWELFYDANTLKWRGGSGAAGGEISVSAPSVNNWHFLVVTQSGTGASLYIDGVLAASSTVTAIGNGSGDINIGRSGSGYYFNGKIDDVRIYNRVLSADEVYSLYNSARFTRYFYVENVCRTNDANFDIAGTAPCLAGQAEDPNTQLVTINVDWGQSGGLTVSEYLTRWKNNSFPQFDWSGGSAGEIIITKPSEFYSSADNIATSTGAIQITTP